MVVADASALVEALLRTEAGDFVVQRLRREPSGFHCPHHIDLECAHALRSLVLRGRLTEERARLALGMMPSMALSRYAHWPFLDRIWQLRSNMSSYDAAYIALAESLGATLLTGDGRLARAAAHIPVVQVF